MRQPPGDSRRKRNRRRPSAGRRARLESLEARQLFSAGSLDTSFAGTGFVQQPLPGGLVGENAVAVQSDQKIVTAGITFVFGGPGAHNPEIELTRYNPDGSLDASFGTDGKVDILLGRADLVTSLAIAPDGKIVIGGPCDPPQALYGGYLARFNTDGTLDSGFGNGGFVLTSQSNVDDAGIGALTIQPDGKILATPNGTHTVFSLERFNVDGTLDPSFGVGGVTNIPAVFADTTSLALENLGYVLLYGSDSSGLKVLQFDPSGTLIQSVNIPVPGATASSTISVDNDGSIVISGNVAEGSNPSTTFPFVARLTSDLNLDPSFGQSGIAQLAQAGSAAGLSNSLLEQPSGKYVLGFNAAVANGAASAGEFGLARLNSDGTPDSTFGSGGLVLSQVGNSSGAIAQQSDLNLVFVGAQTTDDLHGVGIVARFLGNPGAIDQTPNFTKGPNQSLPQDAGPQEVDGWATSISQGTGDGGQALNFVVQSTNPSLFTDLPTISPTGTLKYSPAAGGDGVRPS